MIDTALQCTTEEKHFRMQNIPCSKKPLEQWKRRWGETDSLLRICMCATAGIPKQALYDNKKQKLFKAIRRHSWDCDQQLSSTLELQGSSAGSKRDTWAFAAVIDYHNLSKKCTHAEPHSNN